MNWAGPSVVLFSQGDHQFTSVGNQLELTPVRELSQHTHVAGAYGWSLKHAAVRADNVLGGSVIREDLAEDVAALVLFLGLVGYVVFAFVLFGFGRTPGKWARGIYVQNESGRPADFGKMFVREVIGKPISFVLAWLGFIWILVDRKHQGWHDKLATTYGVHARDKQQPSGEAETLSEQPEATLQQ